MSRRSLLTAVFRIEIIEKSFHVLHKVFPPIGREISAGMGQIRGVTLTKVDRSHRRFFVQSQRSWLGLLLRDSALEQKAEYKQGLQAREFG